MRSSARSTVRWIAPIRDRADQVLHGEGAGVPSVRAGTSDGIDGPGQKGDRPVVRLQGHGPGRVSDPGRGAIGPRTALPTLDPGRPVSDPGVGIRAGLGPILIEAARSIVTVLLLFTIAGIFVLIQDRLDRRDARLNASLLLDGLLFAAGITVTGLAGSPLRFLLLAHAVGVILIVSYRTGIKLVLWHSLLYLLVVEAERAGLLDARFSTDPAGSPAKVAVATIAGLWVLALGTAAFAALGERELRRQKVDLERLSAMVARIEAAPAADGIPQILLEDLSATFGFERGIVLASHVGEPTVMASIPDEGAGDVHVHRGVDALVERAWSERAVVAVRSIDPRTDPTIAALLPSSSNVLVVPMLGDRGRRVGTVVLERGGHDGGIRSWVVSMVAQATAHATLALENAWLSEERKERIDEIRRLQDELEAHNEDLERTVEERTEELRTVISDLEEIDRQRRRLLEHVVRATEEERQKIANDVHDDPVQKMIAVKMRLELLRKTHPGIEDVEHALEVVSGSITSLRHLLFNLRPPILDEEGLAPAIRSFLENAEPPFRWRVDDHTTSQPSTQTRLILYRIAQEALTNARKHSGAERVEVLLTDR